MRRFAILLALVLFAALVSGSARESAAVAKPPPKATAVLAITGGNAVPRLAWLDPATLRQLPGRRSLELPYGGWSPLLSPSGRVVALGGGGADGVRLVDVRGMKITARIARRSATRSLTPILWPHPQRLLVLDRPQRADVSHARLLVIDPVQRRLLTQVRIETSSEHWLAWAQAGSSLVALVARENGLSRLVTYGAGGGVLDATDLSIPVRSLDNDRHMQPGLAVDREGRRAFVVDAATIAAVDLSTFEVSYARLAESRSPFARFLAWLEPVAHAKFLSGFSRSATWLGEDTLAVSGNAWESPHSTATGLQLVDTTTGTTRTIEPRASGHAYSGGILLAFGASRNAETNIAAGMGVAAFASDGTRLWSTLGDEPVWLVETAGGYGYAPTAEEVYPQGVRVIDLATGAVLRTVRGELPFFAVRD